jgi:hypothetical protein
MPRYFMHLVDGDDQLLDPEGVEMPRRAVEGYALRCARDCIAGDVKRGDIDIAYRIEVRDEADLLVHKLEFKDAVTIMTAAGAASPYRKVKTGT